MCVDGYLVVFFFFFNDTATTEIYTLFLHDALPISSSASPARNPVSSSRALSNPSRCRMKCCACRSRSFRRRDRKSTRLELQSRQYLVCRLLLEKKKNTPFQHPSYVTILLPHKYIYL